MEGFMSKHLVKILSICALVVLFPLIVVGSAVCATEAVAVNLTIFLGGEEYAEAGHDVKATVEVDGVASEVEFGSTITVKKSSDIKLTYEGDVVYDFFGWYEGTSAQVNDASEPLSTGNEYSFTIRKDKNITLLKNIKEYRVEYAGTLDDDETPISQTDTLDYGEGLYVPTAVAGATFVGWQVVGGDDITVYNNAIFTQPNRDGNGELLTIKLQPIWSGKMVITYYDSDRETVIGYGHITEQNFDSYEILDGNDPSVQNHLTPGYRFNAWLDEDGNPITQISQIGFVEGNVGLYLSEVALDRVTIAYYTSRDNSRLIAQDVLYEDEFASYRLRTEDNDDVANAIQDGYNFLGWVDMSGKVITKENLEFGNRTYNLYMNLELIEYVTVSYYTSRDGGSLIAQDVLYEDDFASYQLRTVADPKVASAVTKGYSFEGWTNMSGNSITKDDLTFGYSTYNLYLEQKLINFDVKVVFNAIDTSIVDQLTYNVVDGFSKYTKDRLGYNFVGFVYDGNTYVASGTDYLYNGASLGDEVIANDGVTVTALWAVDEELYPALAWKVGFAYEDKGVHQVYHLSGNNYMPIEDSEQEFVNFEDINGYGYKQLEDSLLETYFNGIDINNIYALIDGKYVKVNLTRVVAYTDNSIDGITYSGGDVSDATFMDMLDVANSNLSSSTSSIVITFFFEVA